MQFEIPKEVQKIAAELEAAGFEGYLVGGCVRDLLMGNEILRLRSGSSAPRQSSGPRDWDIATNAKPEEIQKIFPESVYENQFGTVGVKTNSEDPRVKVVEVTTFRKEGKYTDKRHPDEIKFAKTIEEDLSRRDFTVNAMALKCNANTANLHANDTNGKFIIDPFDGQRDLTDKIIRTVGNPEERFAEDALRLMRAVRFAVELSAGGGSFSGGDFSARGGPASGWQIEKETRAAIQKHAGLLEMIAKERIRDELVKMLETPRAAAGIILLEELGLLRFVLPELREGLGVEQNLHHIYTVFEHNVRSLEYAAKQNYSLLVRMASLLHDLGKPKAKRGEGRYSTFYGHEVIGAKMAVAALERLKFPKDFIEEVSHLVRYHMFYYNVGEVTAAGVRRFLARVGPEIVPDLIKLREADRIGSGTPKAVPYKLRHFLFMIEKVKSDPVSPKMLKVKGDDVMKILDIPPGPRVGQILSILLEEVLDDPQKNTEETLRLKIQALGKLSDGALKQLAEKAKDTKEEFEEGVEEDMKKKFFVK